MLNYRILVRAFGLLSNFNNLAVNFLFTAVFFFISGTGIYGQSAGTLDTSFDGDGKVTHTFASIDTANAIIKQPDGKLIIAGWAKTPSALAFAVSRVNADGSLDAGFSQDGRVVFPITSVSRGYAAALQPDGKIIVAGSSGNGFDEDFAVARFNPDGSVDNTFNGTGYHVIGLSYTDTAYSVAVQPDGKIVLIGTADSDFGIVRLNADGSLDSSFDGDGKVLTQVGPGNLSDKAYAGLLQPHGKIIAVGTADVGNNSFQTAIVR